MKTTDVTIGHMQFITVRVYGMNEIAGVIMVAVEKLCMKCVKKGNLLFYHRKYQIKIALNNRKKNSSEFGIDFIWEITR